MAIRSFVCRFYLDYSLSYNVHNVVTRIVCDNVSVMAHDSDMPSTYTWTTTIGVRF